MKRWLLVALLAFGTLAQGCAEQADAATPKLNSRKRCDGCIPEGSSKRPHILGPTGASAVVTPVLAVSFQSDTSPETGTALATFVRATADTGFDDTTGLMVEVTAGTAIIGPAMKSDFSLPDGSDPNGVRTTYVSYLRAQDNEDLITNWTEDACVTSAADTSDVTDPKGGNVAEKFTLAGCAADAPIFERTVTLLSNRDHYAWVWMRSDDSSGNTVKIFVEDADETDVCAVELDTTWKRHSCATGAFAGGETSLTFGVRADGTDNPIVYAFRPSIQRQEEYHTTGDVALTGSDVTVNENDLSYSSVAYSTAGTLALWVNPGRESNRGVIGWDGTDDFVIRIGATGLFQFLTNGLADNASNVATVALAEYTWGHLCFTWDEATPTHAMYLDGADVTDASPDNVWSASGVYGTALHIGSALNLGDSTVAYQEYWDFAMTDAECQVRYELHSSEFP